MNLDKNCGKMFVAFIVAVLVQTVKYVDNQWHDPASL